ncbi:MAG: GcrA family cell cycle regulator, partial [Mesorhizobium sp.]
QKKAASSGTGTAKPAARAANTPRHVTSSVGATALQVQFDAEPVARSYVRPEADNVVVPISRHLQLVELTERTCKWPNGDPLSEDFHFCGNDAGESGPYCRYHARLAFQPASERRRSR